MNTSRSTALSALVIAAWLGTCAWAGPAQAQGAAPTDAGGRAAKMQAELQRRFTEADANGDGHLTRDEAKGKMPRIYQHFDEIDTAHNGYVTMADIKTYAMAQQAAHKAAK